MAKKESDVCHFFLLLRAQNEAVTCKPEVKPIVTMAKGDKTFIWILTLNELMKSNVSTAIKSSTTKKLTNKLALLVSEWR